MKITGILTAIGLLINLSTLEAVGQKTKITTKTTVKSPAATNKSEEGSTEPLTAAEKLPAYPGGNEALENYFNKALEKVAIKEPGGITLNLIIGPTGKVISAKIRKGYKRYENGGYVAYPEIDQAIEEAALKMPTWSPGLDKKKPVTVQQNVYFTLMAPGQTPANFGKTFMSVEQSPQFPGGEAALKEYMKSNLQYPADMKQQQLEGTVFVQFVITRHGNIKEGIILKGLSPSIDSETLRVIAAMPQWVPAIHNGQAVDFRQTLPVQITLNK